MMDQILAKLGDPGFLVSLLVSLGCATTVLLAFMPLLQKAWLSMIGKFDQTGTGVAPWAETNS